MFHALRKPVLTAWLVVVLVACVAASQRAGSSQEAAAYCAGPAEQEMLRLINDFRAGRGLEPLGLSRPLGAAAEAKAREMAQQGYFSHTSPEGVTPRELVERHGYEPNAPIGENLASGHESAEAAFEQWRESDAHRELLLDERFAAVGIARAYDVESRYDWYWVAEFGGVLAEPAEACPATPAADASPVPAGTPVRLLCEGVAFPDGTYDLTCRQAQPGASG